ncbi:helix-turn-helix domain-containing protein [Hoeflea sp.]|uniref:helix-turn-helix domain-containing protein n=1 Tax=Hoeflea sp. TaxID=1940281 RepID=UPI00198EBCD3|nr:helix-turn-helix domain-containing protein [Hoeflea sp.]MBC7279996.1 helix-turn-helix domain-containing protein [Hoeflea sp.]
MTPLLTPAKAAAFLSISVETLAAIVARGDLPYVEVGAGEKRTRRRFDPADLEAYVGERKCRSGNVRDKTHSPTTSRSGVTDIQEILAQRRAARQSAPRPGSRMQPKLKPAPGQASRRAD